MKTYETLKEVIKQLELPKYQTKDGLHYLTDNAAFTQLKAWAQVNNLCLSNSHSKTYPKGFEITDDALIFINDTLLKMTTENENGHRKFKSKVRITFNYC